MIKRLIKFCMVPLLVFFARAVIHRYKPRILMVSGSVGKTSTKDAVAAVLHPHFFIRKSEKSFNSEFGVPFTILGVENPWNNPLSWLKVIKSAIALLILPNHYPNLLVLEVGADRPGDLARILRIATPDVVVVTRLPEIPVHVEAYASPEAVREEEFSPAHALPAGAPLIIPADDPYALDSAMRTGSRIITYGTANDAMVRLSEVDFYKEGKTVAGMRAAVHVDEKKHELVVKGSVGVTQLLPAAAALAVASAFDIPTDAALAALQSYEPPAGRGRILPGINGSIIIDDSYNASPAAVEEALATLKKFPHAKRRIAVLGDMLELGRYSVVEHGRIGNIAKDCADVIVAVGIRSRAFAGAGQGIETMLFDNSRTAAEALPSFVKEGDVILIKGSQSIRMERIAKELLADPSHINRLVRQSEQWEKKV
jgi:UDP-N-acetylmuramyl pentapeptide synthase